MVLMMLISSPQTKGDATIFILRNPINTIESFYKWSLGKYEGKGAHINTPPVSLFRELINVDIDFK